MIDIHTHILPNIDDGSTDLEMSLLMIDMLAKDGVTDIVLTPHFYSDVISLNDFVLKRNNAYSNFIRVYNGNVDLHLGAEVYVTKYLTKYDDVAELCIDKTKYMLIELPFDSIIKDETYNIIEQLIYNYKVTPIIAHVERYPFFNHDKTFNSVDVLISIGCLIQVNTESFLVGKLRKKVLCLIESGRVNFLGSDAHNLKSRPPTYGKAVEVIKHKLGQSYINKLNEYQSLIIL